MDRRFSSESNWFPAPAHRAFLLPHTIDALGLGMFSSKYTFGMTTAAVQAGGWDKFQGLKHGFSTRIGGCSKVYTASGHGELNLGFTAEDDRALVLANRATFLRSVGGPAWHGTEIKTVRQVHSARIQTMTSADAPGSVEADGIITHEPGVMLAVLAADCVPVLVADVKRKIAGAFHAGWRGTASRIVELGVARMVQEFSARPEHMVAAIGPSIGSCCYKVGEELREKFCTAFPYGPELFSEGTHLDLWEANRRQLVAAGIPFDQITVIGECTACTRVDGLRKYFSHRADKGFTGRAMGLVGFL